MKENARVKTDVVEIDIRKLVFAYLQKWWIILLCVLVGGAIAFGYTCLFVTPQYQAEVTIYVNNTRSNQQVEYLTESNLSASARLVTTYINILKSDRVLSEAVEVLEGRYSIEQLRWILSASQVENTEMFRLQITTPDPNEAAAVANVVADVLPDAISEIIEGTSARIVDYATVPTHRFSPSYAKNAVIGALIGAVLGIASITIGVLMDVRIKVEEDITDSFDIPILGRIPTFGQTGGKSYSRYQS